MLLQHSSYVISESFVKRIDFEKAHWNLSRLHPSYKRIHGYLGHLNFRSRQHGIFAACRCTSYYFTILTQCQHLYQHASFPIYFTEAWSMMQQCLSSPSELFWCCACAAECRIWSLWCMVGGCSTYEFVASRYALAECCIPRKTSNQYFTARFKMHRISVPKYFHMGFFKWTLVKKQDSSKYPTLLHASFMRKLLPSCSRALPFGQN